MTIRAMWSHSNLMLAGMDPTLVRVKTPRAQVAPPVVPAPLVAAPVHDTKGEKMRNEMKAYVKMLLRSVGGSKSKR